MKLLHTTSLIVQEFNEKGVPPYAILSHTWGREEATYHDLRDHRANASTKAGYKKVIGFCAIAKTRGFDWVWIDTCWWDFPEFT